MLFYLLLLNGSQTSGASHLPHRENQLLHGLPYTILPAIGISFHRVLKLRYVTSSFRTPFPTNISFSKQALVCKGQMNDEKDKALCLELFKCSRVRAAELLIHTHWHPSPIHPDCSELSPQSISAHCVAIQEPWYLDLLVLLDLAHRSPKMVMKRGKDWPIFNQETLLVPRTLLVLARGHSIDCPFWIWQPAGSGSIVAWLCTEGAGSW